jgi:predicted nucleic acid-binding protein
MPAKAFFDTIVLIYAVAHDDPRNTQAEELLASGGVLSVQILNEFASVARRKILMSWSDVREALDAFRALCPSSRALGFSWTPNCDENESEITRRCV